MSKIRTDLPLIRVISRSGVEALDYIISEFSRQEIGVPARGKLQIQMEYKGEVPTTLGNEMNGIWEVAMWRVE